MGLDKEEQKMIAGLKRLTVNTDRMWDGVVAAVDGEAYTIDVELPNGSVLHDVQLKALMGVPNGMWWLPKMGTTVLLVEMGGYKVMLMAEELEAVHMVIEEVQYVMNADGITMKKGDTTHVMDANGHKLSKGDETMLKIMQDLIKAIKLLTVPTSTGPSGVAINAADFEQINTRLTTLLT